MVHWQYQIQQHEKNQVYDQLGKEKAIDMTDTLIAYMQGQGCLIFLNSKEKIHMHDVFHLIKNTFYVFYFLIIVMIGMLIAMRKDFLVNIRDIFKVSGISIIIITIIAFLFRNNFHWLFVKLHQILFNNDLWLLNPATDVLIILLPNKFFIGFAAAMFVHALQAALFMLIISYLGTIFKK